MAIRKGVGVIIKNSLGEILLQHRSKDPNIINPDKLAFFGGGIRPNEDPITTAVREIKEELNYEIDPRYLKEFKKLEGETYISYIYEYTRPVEQNELQLQEGKEMLYLSPAEIASSEKCLPYVKRLILT